MNNRKLKPKVVQSCKKQQLTLCPSMHTVSKHNMSIFFISVPK